MITDCFPFFNELDLLEIRLNELSKVVDVFILTEATITHQGDKKPLYFEENKSRFSEFNIHHIIVDDYPGVDTSDSWAVEKYQRNCGRDYIRNKMQPKATDIILYSDLDEIPNAERVKEAAATDGWEFARARMPIYYYYMNCICETKLWYPARWIKGSRFGRKKVLRKGRQFDRTFKNSGWHFSYLGDIKYKLDAFAHLKYSRPPFNTPEHIKRVKANHTDIFNRGYTFKIIQDLSFLPKYVLQNKKRFSKHLCLT
jgi:beta-1,4-mannosyl-glycoprotein beta-1,4-N-acetylglucosaminyltransferase